MLMTVLFLPFLLCLVGTKYFIKFLQKHKKFQPIRAESPDGHFVKNKTPTMGGLVITFSILLNILIFCELNSPYIWIMIVLILSFSGIGLLDDVIKVFFGNVKGFQGSKKLILQLFITSICFLYLCYVDSNYLQYGLNLPLFNINIPFGNFIIVIYMLIICGSSNATNITDGLDGLLSIPILIISATLIIMIIMLYNGVIPSVIPFDEILLADLLIVLVSIVGSFSAFLYYNQHPAKIFMGDVGSLMIGSLLCYIAILLKVEILYGIMSILFIVEIMSSVIQVFYYKATHGKRIFKMAPLHHHFEKCGVSEEKIVFFMSLTVFICCVLSLVIALL
jgi:phospho-N-acetylmuramoyl-pentapeptide-transferase